MIFFGGLSEIVHIFAALPQHGTIAQLVEHRTENPGVPGSIPGGTTGDRRIFDPFFYVPSVGRSCH